MNNHPKVSIVTTTYNDSKNLSRIIEQVKKQDYDNIEHIIIDGGSSDQTLQVIKEWEQEAGDSLRWRSEPDNGIYDALNKGIELAGGDIIGSCFDEFAHPSVISKMVETMQREETDGIHGDLVYVEADRVVRNWKQGQGNFRFGWMPGHPTLYLKKEVYQKYGLYKTDYTCSSDYEFMIRFLKDKQVRLSYLPEILIRMSYGGTSTSSFGAYMVSLKEGHRALKENNVAFAWFTDFCRIIRVLLQFIK